MRRLPRAGIWLAIGTMVAGCGGGGTSNNQPLPMLASVSLEVVSFTSVRNGSSNPAVDTIARGGTVTWTWNSNQHDIRSTGSPTFPPDTGTTGTFLDAPRTHQFMFGNAGIYTYYCKNHGTPASGMYGRLVVQ